MENNKKEVGHKLLARLGKTRLRPGGKKATEWLFKQAGFTPQSQVLEIACNMGTTSIEIKQADASKLPFDDNSFDIVINEAMLTMYADKAKAHLLKEYFRVLKPGGKLLTHDMMLLNTENPQYILEQIYQAINVNAQPMSHDGWINLFSSAGFSDIKTSHAPMTLLSPTGMIIDEGFFGALKIFRNALHKQNRQQFFNMLNRFRKNKKYLNYIAVCSVKPKE